ncbi:hypothetical protein [Streptomyces sp. NPDC088760]|uniref:hypothetical protein n=1 Tax=Streptomyces sp. NPDC088760 TaxID=3365890 RepID=UPI003814B9C7
MPLPTDDFYHHPSAWLADRGTKAHLIIVDDSPPLLGEGSRRLRTKELGAVPGVSYDQMPTHPLQREAPTANVWDRPQAPAHANKPDAFGALDLLHLPGAVACSECGADATLGPHAC